MSGLQRLISAHKQANTSIGASPWSISQQTWIQSTNIYTGVCFMCAAEGIWSTESRFWPIGLWDWAPNTLPYCYIFPVLELQGNLLSIGAALISDTQTPKTLGDLKCHSSEGLFSCSLGWLVTDSWRPCGSVTLSMDSGARFLGSGVRSLPLSSCVTVGTLTAFFGSQLSHLRNGNSINTGLIRNFGLLLK